MRDVGESDRPEGVVDRSVIAEIAEAGGVELLGMLAETAETEARARFEQLREACELGSADAVERALHSLKGAGAGIGLVTFGAESQMLLDRAREGFLPDEATRSALDARWRAGFAVFEAECAALRAADQGALG